VAIRSGRTFRTAPQKACCCRPIPARYNRREIKAEVVDDQGARSNGKDRGDLSRGRAVGERVSVVFEAHVVEVKDERDAAVAQSKTPSLKRAEIDCWIEGSAPIAACADWCILHEEEAVSQTAW